MTKSQDTTLDDIAEAISDLGNMTATLVADTADSLRQEMRVGFGELASRMDGLDNRMDGLDNRMDGLDNRMNGLEQNQRLTNERLLSLEGNDEALRNDIKELYRMISELRKDFLAFSADERRRFKALEKFAIQVSIKTGIPFTPS